jgi:nitrogenase molybdenum-iron protein alpha chain
MTNNKNSGESINRESRLGAITGYRGTFGDLVTNSTGCGLKNRGRSFSQMSACSSGCAHTLLDQVLGAAVVNHAPIGCIAHTAYTNVTNLWNRKDRGLSLSNVPVISSNMTEHDTVFGGAEKLRAAVREAYRRFDPKAIFVTTSCASGIIGEDINGILDDLRKEFPIPIAPVYCDGFKSKVWASGFDAAYHAVLTHIVQPPREKHPERVNVINFWGRARKEIGELFAPLGLTPQFIISFSTIEELERISEAGATITNCQTLGSYLGAELEARHGVPLVKSLPPHGIAGIENWLRELGRTMSKEEQVEEVIAQQRALYLPEIEKLRDRLKGKRAVIGMGPGFGHGFIGAMEELGIDVVQVISWHYDQKHDHGQCPYATQRLGEEKRDVPFSVGDQQVFELVNVLRDAKPDIYFSRHVGTSVWAAKMGIATLATLDEYAVFGYRGLLAFGHRIADTLSNREFANKVAERLKLPYTNWWLEQETFKFLKEAVA